ncbi:MAG: methylated-DNA--[protein]-cysteine S-methyltransferase [Prochloraceae cyanobacterium]|nr:methylated-DNA--[protein]-cysteine S-methyltransferase [Prochloraceae cyanobacterium]
MKNYQRIALVIKYIEENVTAQPDLEELAEKVGLSPYHFHRLFLEWAGITPKAFLKSLTVARAKQMLLQGSSVLETSLEIGLSSPSRLHDLCLTLEAATPGEIKKQGAGWTVKVGFIDSPFGNCLIAANHRGICHLSFQASRDPKIAASLLSEDWPHSKLTWDRDFVENLGNKIFNRSSSSVKGLKAFVVGTQFQVKVWRALLKIPQGNLVTYERIARAIDNDRATRAVASAIAKNPIGYLIPCHRVIRKTGVSGQYRWGAERKKAMIAWETTERQSGEL